MKPVEPARNYLFVSHEASRTGAPMILLGIIKEYIQQTDQPVKILLMADGPLMPDFQKLGKTYLWPTEISSPNDPILKKITKPFRRILQILKAAFILYKIQDTQVVILNTITNGHIQKKLNYFKPKFITYVHELEYSIRLLTTASLIESVKQKTSLYLAGSVAVKNNLIQNHKINPTSIKVAYSTIEKTNRNKTEYSSWISKFKETHKIESDKIIIGVASSGEWRKGFDLFIPLILTYFSLFPESNVFFIWKGYRGTASNLFFDTYDLEKIGILNKVCLLPHDNENIETIASFDIHLLLSREDPYPLVNLEAASFGIPTVCFQNAGGTEEFIQNDAGISVPYGDLVSLSNSLHQLVTDKPLRQKLGENARNRVHSLHQVKKTTSDLIGWIEELFKDPKEKTL